MVIFYMAVGIAAAVGGCLLGLPWWSAPLTASAAAGISAMFIGIGEGSYEEHGHPAPHRPDVRPSSVVLEAPRHAGAAGPGAGHSWL